MWSYYPELLEKPVPRYTSYPTAAEFGPGPGEADLDAALRQAQGDVSLYLHIPFCEKICWYCGCNTAANNKAHRLSGYLDALHREIALVGVRLEYSVAVRRIAFGGGSPNAVAPTDFVRLVDALTLHMPLEDPDWSIELDPRGLSEEWGAVLAAVGVRYASLGVQTFDPALQAAIGRIQPDADLVRATDLLRRSGITSLNFDLMYGLPGQSLAQLEATLKRTVELGADRIALFGYAHVPHMLPRQRRIDASHLPDQAARFAMAEFGYQYLTAAGYVPVGFDHFAQASDPLARAVQAGRLRRNFQGFTDDAATTLIGLGASSIGNFPDLLIQNEKNAGRYRMLLSQDRLPAAGGLRRSLDDQRRGAVIEALLCQGEAVINGELQYEVAARLLPFVARGLAELSGDLLRIAPRGLPYARTIAALFDPYRQDSARRFSSAV
ncbi:MAG: oxygen-independent coproporphyrinogen III oxidase [Novosphingobium sp.]|uniref:oxygen-independent coproporphyrinogen III oxidase n=1 Tax=Novosphingobium sp. TaxID=1874826 RepID=UPI003C7B0AD4